jgi:hypothetical protein
VKKYYALKKTIFERLEKNLTKNDMISDVKKTPEQWASHPIKEAIAEHVT